MAEGKAPGDPSCSPSHLPTWRGRQSHLRGRINPSRAGMGRYRVAVRSSSSKARCRSPALQTPKLPGTEHRHPSHAHQHGHRHAVSATVI